MMQQPQSNFGQLQRQQSLKKGEAHFALFELTVTKNTQQQ